MTPKERVMNRIVVHGDGCWTWKPGYGRPHGLGRFMKPIKAVWTVFVGPIPEGSYPMSTCGNGECVNPDHVELRRSPGA